MAQWRKVIVSGSTAELNHVSSSGNLVPTITDGGSLGDISLNWSDLFLDSGAVINFDGGDVTATHASNLLTITGGNVRVDKLEIDGFNARSHAPYFLINIANKKVLAKAHKSLLKTKYFDKMNDYYLKYLHAYKDVKK